MKKKSQKQIRQLKEYNSSIQDHTVNGDPLSKMKCPYCQALMAYEEGKYIRGMYCAEKDCQDFTLRVSSDFPWDVIESLIRLITLYQKEIERKYIAQNRELPDMFV